MQPQPFILHLRRLGIDSYKEAILYIRQDCHICRAEGFETQSRVYVRLGDRSIIATLNFITSDILEVNKASLSEYAWCKLGAKEGDGIQIAHARPLESLSSVRSKIYGKTLSKEEIYRIIYDITAGRYSDIHIAAFLAACANGHLNLEEITSLTKAMIDVGDSLTWDAPMVVDKHCVGGLPGNRTTPIVVPIVAAFGLTMPKTSSRAITSPAGTADTMEVFAPVDLSLTTMKKVVEHENGCIVWGGSVSLSPADDILIGVERTLSLDSEGQMVASILSKKVAAGATHVLIDIPIGPTAKIRTKETAALLKNYLEVVGKNIGLVIKIIFSDGMQPIGRGIGPSLEARDVAQVLQRNKEAPKDLREHALTLAGSILEFSPTVKPGEGLPIATQILDSGKAWDKFQKICAAQGGMRPLEKAKYTHTITAPTDGTIKSIDNRSIALVARLAGAPHDKLAGVDLHTPVGTVLKKGRPLYTVQANTPGGLEYALEYLYQNNNIIQIEKE